MIPFIKQFYVIGCTQILSIKLILKIIMTQIWTMFSCFRIYYVFAENLEISSSIASKPLKEKYGNLKKYILKFLLINLRNDEIVFLNLRYTIEVCH